MHSSIAIDATHYENEAPTGVEGYTRELIDRLVPILINEGVGVTLIMHHEPTSAPKGAHIIISPYIRFWSARRLPQLLRALAPTIYFTPSGIPPRNLPCLTACTVHDLAVYHDARSFSPADRLRLTIFSQRSAKQAALIFTPSEYTKSEVQSHWNIPAKKIVVTPLAVDPSPAATKAIPGIDPTLPIIAYLGRIERKKNVSVLIDAMHSLAVPAQLVLAGRTGYGGERLLTQARELKKKVHVCGYITDAQKHWLLSNASVLAVPSPIEGFGIPVLEGFQSGVPVFCSRSGSLPEVGGNAVYYLPYDSPSAWAEAFARVLSGDIDVKALISAGHKRAKQFSWDQTAQITAEHLLNHLS